MIFLGPFTVVQARRFIAEKEKLLRAFLAFATIELTVSTCQEQRV